MQTSSRGFTVEQVELIRRLRNSGVTCQQIIEAFQALDRIDAELGSLYAIPTNLTVKNESQSLDSIKQPSSTSLQASQSNTSTSYSVLAGTLNHRSNAISHLNSLLSHGPFTSASTDSTASPILPVSLSFKPTAGPVVSTAAAAVSANVMASSAGKFSDTLRDVAQASLSAAVRPAWTNHHKTETPTPDKKDKTNNNSIDGTVQNSPRSSVSPSLYDKLELREMTLDRFVRLLLSLNGETLRMLVQKFVLMIPEFDQHKQAAVLGVDEMAFYNFLSGHWPAIDSNARSKLFTWFFNHIKPMDWFFEDLAQLLKMRECSEGLDIHFVPRRERFTFRDKHIEVLEMFFKKGQYPTQEEKEHIANECNLAMSMGHYRELTEKEKMSHINVTNWFSNRRKEIKRLAKQGGIETEQVILPSRLKTRMLSHLPTYNELQEEAARQKVMGMSPSLPTGSFHSISNMSYPEQDSPSQDNSSHIGHFSPHSSVCSEADATSHRMTVKSRERDTTSCNTLSSSGSVETTKYDMNVKFLTATLAPAVPQTLVRNEHSRDDADSTMPADQPIKFEPMDD